MRSRWRGSPDLAFLAFLIAVMVLSAGGHLVVGDEETMFRVTQNMLGGLGLSVGREVITISAESYPTFLPRSAESLPTTSAVPGRDSRLYSKYGPGQSLAAVPLYGLGMLVSGLSSHEFPVETTRRMVSMLNPLALACCGWLTVVFGRRLGYRPATARWLALAFIFASMAWPYVKTFYPQPGVTLLLLLAAYTAFRWRKTAERRWLVWLGLASGSIILFRVSESFVVLFLGLYLLLSPSAGRRGLGPASLAIATICGLGVTGIYSWLRFGSLLSTGYHEVAWTTPFLLGVYGLLFSPGKGVLLYTPLLVLCLAGWAAFVRRHRPEAWLLAGLWAGYLILYAPYNFWTGGFNWGPRFLLPLIPLTFLTLGALIEESTLPSARVLFVVLFLMGLVIQLPAVLVDHSRYLYRQLAEDGSARAYDNTIFRPADSPILHQWPVALQVLADFQLPQTRAAAATRMQEFGTTTPAQGIPNYRELLVAEFQRRNTPDFWWYNDRLVRPQQFTSTIAAICWVLVGLAGLLLLRKWDRVQT